MVAEIIAVAAADELIAAHPGEQGTLACVALTLGGTALFLARHTLLKWAIFGVLSQPRVVGIAALIALIPVGFEIPMLALGGASLIVVILVAV
jgi:low temperature requirement protein LtrA